MEPEPTEALTERAPLLLVFGDLSGRVAALVRARPILMARLIVAPREAVHAIAAYLHLAPDAAGPDVEVATIINDSDPRELLRAALPGCPPRLYRALDRAGDRVRERRYYERLGEVAAGPFGDALLEGDRPLDHGRLSYFELLARMDPLIISLRSALPESQYAIEAVDALLAFLRLHDALTGDDLALPPRSALPAVVRRLTRALGRVAVPAPEFECPAPYRFVTSTAELQRIGRAFGNCVALPQWNAAQHHIRLITGAAVYLVADTPPVLISLLRVGRGLWVLDQMAGPKNTEPREGTRDALLRDLAAAGLRIIAVDPAAALSRLDGEMRRRRRIADPDNDDEVDDEGEELAA
jgi:hypothetical protein